MTPIPPACPFEALFCEPCTANAEIADLRLRCGNLRATRDELAAENARLDAALERTKTYAAYCYGCAKVGEKPMTYEEFLSISKGER